MQVEKMADLNDMQEKTVDPRKTLSVIDGIALIIGVVVGTGIFKTPSLVAANTGDNHVFLLTWFLGGAVSLIGALCYAELAVTYPHSGGDYHYLSRAFGQDVGFLFGWARMTVIQPGSIAMLAFVFGDYLSQLLPPFFAPPFCAILAVVIMTSLNVIGTRQGTRTQNILTAAKVIGLVAVLIAGVALTPPLPVLEEPGAPGTHGSFGLAMVFVLLTFGGWNEAAYISAELRTGKKAMVHVLLWGIGAITVIYLLAGFAFLKGLGLDAMGRSEVVAADLMRKVFGEGGAGFVSFLIAVSALGGINATIFTGARTTYALGRDFSLFGVLGHWREKTNSPANALVLQGAIAAILVLLGALTRKGFVTMVEFTAPVFWLFFLLTGVSLFVLRQREPEVPRAFMVPLYPLIPLIFCATCLYMLRASIAYTGIGALAGLVVLFTGAIFLVLVRAKQKNKAIPETSE
jgi:APA family basic amino acid/polyamine antiporter